MLWTVHWHLLTILLHTSLDDALTGNGDAMIEDSVLWSMVLFCWLNCIEFLAVSKLFCIYSNVNYSYLVSLAQCCWLKQWRMQATITISLRFVYVFWRKVPMTWMPWTTTYWVHFRAKIRTANMVSKFYQCFNVIYTYLKVWILVETLQKTFMARFNSFSTQTEVANLDETYNNLLSAGYGTKNARFKAIVQHFRIGIAFMRTINAAMRCESSDM